MLDEILEKKIRQTKEEIATADLMIGFMNWMTEQEKDKEKSATYKVKADQISLGKKINEKFLEYTETL